ncbi:CLUMA_CG006642, isoform A [Clunio marinus]|uniref:CLUMA_CG006642, isoform A n=1 Tax=Clunio marinus TaxID=568069 RepID=A0A1J1I018_9DIPT|nr:CLUMA_CG006642, isoform A [Clunio marinus]
MFSSSQFTATDNASQRPIILVIKLAREKKRVIPDYQNENENLSLQLIGVKTKLITLAVFEFFLTQLQVTKFNQNM